MKPADAILLTADLAVRASLTTLVLEDNRLCGVYSDGSGGPFNADGLIAISAALKQNTSLKTLSLARNDLANKSPHAKGGMQLSGVQELAAALAINASLMRVDVRLNSLGEEGEEVLRTAVEGRSGLELIL